MRTLAWGLTLVAALGAAWFLLRATREAPTDRPAVQAPAPAEPRPAQAPPPTVEPTSPAPQPTVEEPLERESAPPPDLPLAALMGRVRYEDGSPAAGLALRIFAHSGGANAREARTDADGQFEFVLESGVWQLAGEAPPEFLSFRAEVRLAPDDAPFLELVLLPSRPLCVRVWCAREGVIEPLAGARVGVLAGLADGVEQRAWPTDGALSWFAVDADGRCDVRACPNLAQMLYVEAPGYLAAAIQLDARGRALAEIAQEDGCVHVFLDALGPKLRGRVLGANGKALAGALVSVSAPTVEERGRALDFGMPGERSAGVARLLFSASTQPPLARTDVRGEFVLQAPDLEASPRRSIALIVHPLRDEYPHHQRHELDFWSLGADTPIEIRVNAGHEYVLAFVDAQGALVEGLASVRDPDGRPHAPLGRVLEAHLDETTSARYFQTVNGQVRLRHVGGPVVVGLSPGGVWREEEQTVTLPFGGSSAPVQVLVER